MNAPCLPRNCPKCGSSRVHRSRRRGMLDGLLSHIGGEIRRCHDCRSRRCWFGTAALPLARDGVHEETRTGSLVLGTAFLVCLALVWWTVRRFAGG
jgi:hypothetical protein